MLMPEWHLLKAVYAFFSHCEARSNLCVTECKGIRPTIYFHMHGPLDCRAVDHRLLFNERPFGTLYIVIRNGPLDRLILL